MSDLAGRRVLEPSTMVTGIHCRRLVSQIPLGAESQLGEDANRADGFEAVIRHSRRLVARERPTSRGGCSRLIAPGSAPAPKHDYFRHSLLTYP